MNAADPAAKRIVAEAREAMDALERGTRSLPAFVEAAIAGYLEREDPGPGDWDRNEDTAPYRAMAREGVTWGYLFRVLQVGAGADEEGRVDLALPKTPERDRDRLVAQLHDVAGAPDVVLQVSWRPLEAWAEATVKAAHPVETMHIDWVDHGRAVRFGYLLGSLSRP